MFVHLRPYIHLNSVLETTIITNERALLKVWFLYWVVLKIWFLYGKRHSHKVTIPNYWWIVELCSNINDFKIYLKLTSHIFKHEPNNTDFAPCFRRGLIMGIWNSHTSVGNILGSIIAGIWVDGDWGYSFVVPGIIVASLGVLVFLFLVPGRSKSMELFHVSCTLS